MKGHKLILFDRLPTPFGLVRSGVAPDHPETKVSNHFVLGSKLKSNQHFIFEFCYDVSNQYESFICLDLMVKNREIPIERYFKWWSSIKLVWVRYQNY
jgi:hypothetical protein